MILRSVPLGNPAPGTQPPFGTWKFIPPNGVQTSFNPATGHGAIHTMTITGDFVSAFMEDIELDIGIEQKPWRVNCADGLCASMKYTVVEMDVELEQATESDEEPGGTGEYVIADTDDQITMELTAEDLVILPADMQSYIVYHEIQGTDGNECDRAHVEGPARVEANQDLAHEYGVRGDSESAEKDDTRLRIILEGNQDEEVGGGSCRDSAYFTVLEADVINPLREQNGHITTPAEDGVNNDGSVTPGNEYSYDNSATGAFSIMWRMTLAPDAPEIRSDLDGRLQLGMTAISGSNRDYPLQHGNELVYHDDDHEWYCIVDHSTLPSANTALGDHDCTVDLFSDASGARVGTITRSVEIFYHGADGTTNHPGGSTPNWYYYWFQTSAGYSVSADFEYDSSSATAWSSWTSGTTYVCHLGYGNNDSRGIQGYSEMDNAGSTVSGIDYFGWVVRHEYTHKATGSALWPAGYDASADQDTPSGDLLPDSQEAALGGTAGSPINWGPFDPTVKFTTTPNWGMGDSEHYTCSRQRQDRHWVIGSADSEDWSRGGKQW